MYIESVSPLALDCIVVQKGERNLKYIVAVPVVDVAKRWTVITWRWKGAHES